jgi:uncharacterized membrane protein SirB2
MMQVILPIHMSCAVTSLLLFIWRGVSMWREKPVQQHLWRRTVPDAVDTLLLITGITMAALLEVAPWENGWLAAKLIALLTYIGLGTVAFRFGRTLLIKRSCFITALIVFAYIISVARSMDAWPWV